MWVRISSPLGNNFLLTFPNLYFSFQNDICQGTGDIPGRSGICWTKEECAALKGIADGGCANGYGVCCICKCKFLTKVGLVLIPVFILDVQCTLYGAKGMRWNYSF